MKERGIIFGAPMIRALIAGTKTQTRRITKFVAREDGFNLGFSGVEPGHYCTGAPSTGHVLYSRRGDGVWGQRTNPLHCPYGAPGDRLWIREAHRFETFSGEHFYNDADGYSRSYATTHIAADPGDRVWYCADGDAPVDNEGWTPARPSIFLPRWASRITLEITDVHVERLQSISEENARAEGVWGLSGLLRDEDYIDGACRMLFRNLWESINGKRAPWSSNPFCWVISFRRITS